MAIKTSRRGFLQGSAAAGAGLIVGFNANGLLAAASNQTFMPNPFVKVLADNSVVVIAKHFEMGQGTTTGLATLVAEELDADWDQVTVEWAPVDETRYSNLLLSAQGTGGSTAIANSYQQYRKAGAAAKQLLVEAAAVKWRAPASQITVSNGIVSHPSGKRARFGDLCGAASKLELSGEPVLKDARNFKLIGKTNLRRKDSWAKTDGTAIFALDVKIPGMVYAVVARPPKFGGKVKSFNPAKALKVRGVVEVKEIPRGVVVYARNTWAAIKGRNVLEVSWDLSAAEHRSSDDMIAEYREKLKMPGLVAREEGDAEKGLAGSANKVSAEFVFPFLAHAPMEPLNCVIRFDGKSADIWDGCQFPSLSQPAAASVLGIKPERVTIHTVYAGGSFGRRANPTSDYVTEAAMAVKAIEGQYPVQLMWTREDDIRGGYYRPMFAERIEAGVATDGEITAWKHRLAGKSILGRNGIDHTSVDGALTLPYKVTNITVDVHNMETPISVLWWRSVAHSHTAYSTEVVMDMLAEAAGADPVEFRLKALGKHPRLAGVLKAAAEKSGWGRAIGKGKGRGVAVHESFNSFVALVVEISVGGDGAIKVERVICAVDCGIVVNPDIVKAQMEGGIGYGLGSAMRNKISFDRGQVVEANFPDYAPLRISDMPDIEVHIVPSAEPPTGVGEPAVPVVAPALANAIYGATGKRIFTLPMTDSGMTFA